MHGENMYFLICTGVKFTYKKSDRRVDFRHYRIFELPMLCHSRQVHEMKKC